MTISANEPSEVVSTISFGSHPPGESAYTYVELNPATGKQDSNISHEDKVVVVQNLRGKEDTVSLDKTGFQFFHAPSRHKAFSNDQEIKQEYYPEVIEYIKKFTGASKVFIFDHSE